MVVDERRDQNLKCANHKTHINYYSTAGRRASGRFVAPYRVPTGQSMNSYKQVKNNSHILTSPSQPPVANMLPTGLRSTDLTKELVSVADLTTTDDESICW